MALFNVTLKNSRNVNGIHLEKGMSVEVVTRNTSNPLCTLDGREAIVNAFIQKYNVDLKKACSVSNCYLDVVKIN